MKTVFLLVACVALALGEVPPNVAPAVTKTEAVVGKVNEVPTVAQAPPDWKNSKDLFTREAVPAEEPSFLSVLTNMLSQRKDDVTKFVKEKVQHIVGVKDEDQTKKDAHSLTNSSSTLLSEQQSSVNSTGSEEEGEAADAFKKAFQQSLGEDVIVVVKEEKPAVGAAAGSVASSPVVVEAEVVASLEKDGKQQQKLAQHLLATTEIEKEKLAEAEKELDAIDADSVNDEIEEEEPDLSKLINNKVVAQRVGGVLGHLFRQLGKVEQREKGEITSGDVSSSSAAGAAASSPAANPKEIQSMQQWALRQLAEMQGVVDLREELRRAQEETLMGEAAVGSLQEQQEFTASHHQRSRRGRDWHRGRRHGRHGRHGRRGHMHQGRHERRWHGRRHHGGGRDGLGTILNHLMNDRELPESFSQTATQIVALPDGHMQLQVKLGN